MSQFSKFLHLHTHHDHHLHFPTVTHSPAVMGMISMALLMLLTDCSRRPSGSGKVEWKDPNLIYQRMEPSSGSDCLDDDTPSMACLH